jgi:hypothetical protein
MSRGSSSWHTDSHDSRSHGSNPPRSDAMMARWYCCSPPLCPCCWCRPGAGCHAGRSCSSAGPPPPSSPPLCRRPAGHSSRSSRPAISRPGACRRGSLALCTAAGSSGPSPRLPPPARISPVVRFSERRLQSDPSSTRIRTPQLLQSPFPQTPSTRARDVCSPSRSSLRPSPDPPSRLWPPRVLHLLADDAGPRMRHRKESDHPAPQPLNAQRLGHELRALTPGVHGGAYCQAARCACWAGAIADAPAHHLGISANTPQPRYSRV